MDKLGNEGLFSILVPNLYRNLFCINYVVYVVGSGAFKTVYIRILKIVETSSTVHGETS